jgi:hypothetical protein
MMRRILPQIAVCELEVPKIVIWVRGKIDSGRPKYDKIAGNTTVMLL